MEWICPASKQPGELQRCLTLIGNFLLDPLDLNGKKALQMVSKVTKRKKRRTAPDGYGSLQDDDPDGLGVERGNKRKAKRQKENQHVLSAQLIEDSDAELGDDDAFFAAEAALRARMAKAADTGVSTQRTGTKKRKKKDNSDNDMDSDRSGTRKKARKSIKAKTKRNSSTPSEEENSDSESASDHNIIARRTKKTSTRRRSRIKDGDRESPSASSPPLSRAPSSIADSSEVEDDNEERDRDAGGSDSEMPVPNAGNSQRKLQRLSGPGTIGNSGSEMEEDEEDDIAAIKQPSRPARRLLLSDEEDD